MPRTTFREDWSTVQINTFIQQIIKHHSGNLGSSLVVHRRTLECQVLSSLSWLNISFYQTWQVSLSGQRTVTLHWGNLEHLHFSEHKIHDTGASIKYTTWRSDWVNCWDRDHFQICPCLVWAGSAKIIQGLLRDESAQWWVVVKSLGMQYADLHFSYHLKG